MCQNCEWEEYKEKAYDLLDDLDYEYAADVVQGIHDWIKDNEHVTDKQKKALNNISDNPSDDWEKDDYYDIKNKNIKEN